jgi:hypothetical protein
MTHVSTTGFRLFCLWSGLALTACAHQYNLPANRFDGPESLGRPGAMQAEVAGFQTGNQLTINPSLTDSSQPSSTLDNFQINYMLGFAVGVTDKIDAGIRLQPNGPLLFRGKIQLLGKPEPQSRPGDISATIVLTSGITLVSETDRSGSGTSLDLSARYTTYSGHMILGGRLTPKLLLYVGGGFTGYGYSGSLQEANGGPKSSDFSGGASQPGFFVGFRTSAEAVFFGAELTKTFVTAGSEEATGYYPGVVLGLKLF